MEQQIWKSPTTGVEYTLRKLNFGEVSRILDESQKIDPRNFTITSSHWTRRLLTIKQAVVTPTLTDKQIEEFTHNEGLALFNAINDFNEVPLGKSPEPCSNTETSNPPTKKSETS